MSSGFFFRFSFFFLLLFHLLFLTSFLLLEGGSSMFIFLISGEFRVHQNCIHHWIGLEMEKHNVLTKSNSNQTPRPCRLYEVCYFRPSILLKYQNPNIKHNTSALVKFIISVL